MSAPGAVARPAVERLIRAALEEDVGDGDRTTAWTVDADAVGRARIIARSPGIIAGTEPAGRVFAAIDEGVEVAWEGGDGGRVAAGDRIARLEGPLRSILSAERVALNFLARLSGVATLAARYVEAVAGSGATIVDTRKTTPGWRRLEKDAVVAGGATNHRMGLYDMVLIKENHARACGGIAAALEAVAAGAAREGLEVEVEVSTLDELEEALSGEPDRILLDNMEPAELRVAVARVARSPEPRPLLEASGGVDLGSVRAVADTGVDLISVGAITHSAPALDLSLLVEAP
ncbi:MAG: carboxylating nicotinate-nucleotide diphosphorylase [Gemmatimonadota bacterium]|nr:carboxylating nicotinate-nucleotide diphosphorylase [Gemmatimonadota bacterium]